MFFLVFAFWIIYMLFFFLFLGILGPPYCGIGTTIRIGREMLCLPDAGFLPTGPVLGYPKIPEHNTGSHQSWSNLVSTSLCRLVYQPLFSTGWVGFPENNFMMINIILAIIWQSHYTVNLSGSYNTNKYYSSWATPSSARCQEEPLGLPMALYCTALYCTALHCTALHWFVL